MRRLSLGIAALAATASIGARAQDGRPEKPAIALEVAPSGTGALAVRGTSTLPDGVVVYLRARYGESTAAERERDFATVKAIVKSGRLVPIDEPARELKIGPFGARVLLPGPYSVSALFMLDRQTPEVRARCLAPPASGARIETEATGTLGTPADLARHLDERRRYYDEALRDATAQLDGLCDAFGEVSWSFFAPKKDADRPAAIRAWVGWVRATYPALLGGDADADVKRFERWIARGEFTAGDGAFRPEPWRRFLDGKLRVAVHARRRAHRAMLESVVVPSDSRSAADLEVALSILEGFATNASKRAYQLQQPPLPLDPKDDEVTSPELAGAPSDEPVERVRRLDRTIRERLGIAREK